MKWIKETKGKRQAAIGAVFLVVFLSLVMALSCAEFYKRYKEQESIQRKASCLP